MLEKIYKKMKIVLAAEIILLIGLIVGKLLYKIIIALFIFILSIAMIQTIEEDK